jgi:23S rRNA (guanine745-N1)-methyltransferase
VNLLQPQDRRSANPGDSRLAVEARALLEEAGIGEALIGAVRGIVDELALAEDAVIVDLGSGTGRALATITAETTAAAVGIDLSVEAIAHAAKRWRGPAWVVANADRRLPLLDRSVNLVLSLHARRNPAEVARVLAPDGALLIAVPAPDDLIELRTLVQGAGVGRGRVAALEAEHEKLFILDSVARVTDERHLDPKQLRLLLAATYRGARSSESPRVAALGALSVTMASELCLFRRRPGGRASTPDAVA